MYRSISRTTIKKSALLIIACITVLTLTSLFYMRELNKQVEEINSKYTYKVELLFKMSQIVRDRSFDIFSMSLSNDAWFKDEVFLRFNKRALDFILLREKLLKSELSPALHAELDKIFNIIKTTQPLQEKIVESFRLGELDKSNAELINEDLPLETELYKKFDNLILLATAETAKQQRLLEDKYQAAIVILLMFSIIIVLATVIIMGYSMRRIHENEMNISWDAVHDHLTRVYNRRWLTNYLSNREKTLEENERHAILFTDLDNFKPINDEFGHSAGDKVLVDVVEIFKKCIRKSDVVVRVGGDEFVILLENCSESKVKEIAIAILDRLSDYKLPYEKGEIQGLSCSIGVGFIDQQTSWQQALQLADEECNKVKRQGKQDVSFHSHSFSE